MVLSRSDPVTRTDIEVALKRYSGAPRDKLPAHLRNPGTEFEFCIAFAVYMIPLGVTPIYDDKDFLTGWAGVTFK